MEISTSTNICAFTPGRERNGFDFCIAQCAQGGYKVLDINFCESMNPHSRMRNDDWQDYVKDIAEMGRRWGVVFRQSHLPYYDIFAENDEEKVKTMEELIRRSIAHIPNAEAELFSGLLADYARQKNACIIVKGVRNITDFDSEMQMARINQGIEPELETLLLPARAEFEHFSSTMAREMIRYGQPLTKYVPAPVAEELMKGCDH